ncbi:thiamine diphosphokinase [Serpentinicella sp. ANB-PHB4]|uniref:thiamine diphosphokinase n=1 Tax=Serpentinicella sp. ANB-PHB4 TaxID=3074076 RepID=UPI0028612C51|nr:thiamine diphosphokinase [Serpentinicella sp. ANB-PHB4]MDR5658314.1 thiamine diphosphokinase [Serpentinicella sp. ANB-PHB4]
MKVLIVTNGEIKNLKRLNFFAKNHDYIICADGAVEHLRKINYLPDILVGDFDSISKDDMKWIVDNNTPYKQFPKQKDYTDTELALNDALKLKPSEIAFYGSIGSRFDHSLGNVYLLIKGLDKNVPSKIIGDDFEIHIVNKSKMLYISGEEKEILSLIPITTRVEGVTSEGLLYKLDNDTLIRGSSRSISNEFKGGLVKISVEEGLLLAIKTINK